MMWLLAYQDTRKEWLHKFVKRSCYGHLLNLDVSDTVRQCTVIGKAFDIYCV